MPVVHACDCLLIITVPGVAVGEDSDMLPQRRFLHLRQRLHSTEQMTHSTAAEGLQGPQSLCPGVRNSER